MSLRNVRAVAGRAFALLAAGLVVVVLALVVIIPKAGGATAYTVLTGSMRPGMPPGTLVVVRPEEPSHIRVGDVLTYQLESGKPAVATHRVVKVGVTMDGRYRFTLRGDANGADDPAVVRPEQIRGVRWYAVPYLAYPALVTGGSFREVIVLGSVVILFGYAAVSFAGAARDGVRNRRRSPEVFDEFDTEGRPFAEARS